MKWSLQIIKSLSYRATSITVQIVFIGILTGTWQWTGSVLLLNGLLILLYTAYDRWFGILDKFIYHKAPLEGE